MNATNQTNNQQMPGCLSWLVFLVVLTGMIIVGIIRYSTSYLATASVTDTTWIYGPAGAAIQFLVTTIPLALLARFWPTRRMQIAYRALLLASLLILLLLPVHFMPLLAAQGRMLAQIFLIVVFCFGLAWLYRRDAAGENIPEGTRLKPAEAFATGASAPPIAAAPAEEAQTPAAQALYETAGSLAAGSLAAGSFAASTGTGDGAQALYDIAAYPGRISQPEASLDVPLLRWAIAGGVGVAAALPWINYGALGSFLDTLLAILLAFSLGVASAMLCELFLFAPLRRTSASRFEDFIFGALAAGGVLFLLFSATAFAFSGLQLLMILSFPLLGWVMSGLNMLFPGSTARLTIRESLGRLGPLVLLVGLAASGPIASIDPDELILVANASQGELLVWATTAAARTFVTLVMAGLAFTIAGWLTARRVNMLSRPAGRYSCLGLLLAGFALAVICAATNSVENHPTFNGDRLFVIMKDQADLSAMSSIEDPNERRSQVYQTLVQHAQTTQADLRSDLDSLGVAYTPYYLVNGLEIQGEPALRYWLENRQDVDRVLDSPRMRPLPRPLPEIPPEVFTPPPATPQWNLTMIGADRVWKDFQAYGQGIMIGQSDSGVDLAHPEIKDQFRGDLQNQEYSWFDPWYGRETYYDYSGHGTHTIGSIVGRHTGVAPQAEFFACANLARNLGNPALYLDCWQFMLAPFPFDGDPFTEGNPELGAQVLNNSWGCPDVEGCDPGTFSAAARALRDAGVFVVVSAGNDGPTCGSLNDPPAVDEDVFAVGAIDQGGEIAGFSNIGPTPGGVVKPDVLAPGVNVLSSIPGGDYDRYSGTSMAGPHVVGVVALMWSANPELIGNIDATTQILRETAKPYTGGYFISCPGSDDFPSTASGYGVVDAYAAVQAAIDYQGQ